MTKIVNVDALADRQGRPPRQPNPWLGLLALALVCGTAIIITFILTS